MKCEALFTVKDKNISLSFTTLWATSAEDMLMKFFLVIPENIEKNPQK